MGPTKSAVVDRLAGNVLRLARLERGMTQRELADVAGVAQSTIARIKSGARQPSLPLIARVLDRPENAVLPGSLRRTRRCA